MNEAVFLDLQTKQLVLQLAFLQSILSVPILFYFYLFFRLDDRQPETDLGALVEDVSSWPFS